MFIIKKIGLTFYSICLVDRNPLVKKDYICEWVKKYLETNDGDISWKLLQSEMETKFGIKYSRNGLKNIWNADKRRSGRVGKDATEEMDKLVLPVEHKAETYTKH